MFAEIHRHFVLFRGHPHRFKQIVVVEMERFEVRMIENDSVVLNPVFTDNDLSALAHPDLNSAVLRAEKEYTLSVREGWRALTPTMNDYPMLIVRRAVA